MLHSLTMALSVNMTKNKDFLLILDLYEKWNKATLTPHLISASCAKNFDAVFGHRICRNRYTGL